VRAVHNAFDRAAIYDQSARRPAVRELRLADMDRDGVETQVIFGPIFQISTDDPVGLPMLPESPCEGRIDVLTRGLVFDAGGVRDTAGRIEDLQGNQISPVVIVENHTGLVLVALGHGDVILQNHGQGVGLPVVCDLHVAVLQYLSILLVR
jgi:hypothetical protein